MLLEIKRIPPEDTYPLRHQILRPNQTIEACKYPADHEQDALHLGAYMSGELISIASFYKEKHTDIKGEHHYRLRGMATHPEFRLQKAGTYLIHKAESILREKQADALWCNARTTVSDYYKKLGFYEVGNVFDIHPIGPHIVMAKAI
ncbi:GNAT family N-acetyltransferase [Pontibacillus marinus]|uniref:GNAT family N-acetyltransferase n=1 Tax=Pontibacillus marinus TaxID=273164 RepID=UPI00055ED443|nr:GNAT family N-acetyltransferase [Pontibacillus marinus]